MTPCDADVSALHQAGELVEQKGRTAQYGRYDNADRQVAKLLLGPDALARKGAGPSETRVHCAKRAMLRSVQAAMLCAVKTAMLRAVQRTVPCGPSELAGALVSGLIVPVVDVDIPSHAGILGLSQSVFQPTTEGPRYPGTYRP